MGRINHDINRYYKRYGLILDTKVKEKLKEKKRENSDFCIQLQEIMDPILGSFNIILKSGENSIVSKVSINTLVNNILLGILDELDEYNECLGQCSWLSQERLRELKIPPFSFVSKKEK